MRNQRQVVDYSLRRRSLLARFRAGRIAREEICDAGPYLLRAASFHGERTEHDCPVCRIGRITLVAWIFGAALGQASGSARKPDELERMSQVLPEITVHVVEVCPSCRWNHLSLSYVVGTGEPGSRRPAPRARKAATR